MKRFVGLLLAICLLVVLCVPAFAVGVEKLPEATFDGTSQAKIMDIPIFVILTDGIELTEEQKDKATASVANYSFSCRNRAKNRRSGAAMNSSTPSISSK